MDRWLRWGLRFLQAPGQCPGPLPCAFLSSQPVSVCCFFIAESGANNKLTASNGEVQAGFVDVDVLQEARVCWREKQAWQVADRKSGSPESAECHAASLRAPNRPLCNALGTEAAKEGNGKIWQLAFVAKRGRVEDKPQSENRKVRVSRGKRSSGQGLEAGRP